MESPWYPRAGSPSGLLRTAVGSRWYPGPRREHTGGAHYHWLYTRRHLVLLQVARGNSRLMMAPLLRDAVLLWALHHVALRHLDNPEAAKLDAGLHPSQHTQGAERLGHALQGTQHRQVSCKDTVSCSTGSVNIRVAWAQDRQDEHPIADWLIRPVKGRSQDALLACPAPMPAVPRVPSRGTAQACHALDGGEVVLKMPESTRTRCDATCDRCTQRGASNGSACFSSICLTRCERESGGIHDVNTTVSSKRERGERIRVPDGSPGRDGRRTARPVAWPQTISIGSQGWLKDSVSSEATQRNEMNEIIGPAAAAGELFAMSVNATTDRKARGLSRRARAASAFLARAQSGATDQQRAETISIDRVFILTSASRSSRVNNGTMNVDDDNHQDKTRNLSYTSYTMSEGCMYIQGNRFATSVSDLSRTGTRMRRAGQHSSCRTRATFEMGAPLFSPRCSYAPCCDTAPTAYN